MNQSVLRVVVNNRHGNPLPAPLGFYKVAVPPISTGILNAVIKYKNVYVIDEVQVTSPW